MVLTKYLKFIATPFVHRTIAKVRKEFDNMLYSEQLALQDPNNKEFLDKFKTMSEQELIQHHRKISNELMALIAYSSAKREGVEV